MYASKQWRKKGNGRSSGSGGERIGMMSTSMLAEEWRKRKGDGGEEGREGGKDVVDWTGRGRWSQRKYASGGSIQISSSCLMLIYSTCIVVSDRFKRQSEERLFS